MLLTFLLLVPILAAISVSFVKREQKIYIKHIMFAASALEIFFSASVISQTIASGIYSSTYYYVDSLSALLIFIITVGSFSAGIYSMGYLHEENKKDIVGFSRIKQFFILLNLFIFTMFFAVMVSNPALMWIAIEATTLSTAFLISFYNKPSAMEAAWKYLIINSVGLLLGFLGTLILLAVSSSHLEGTELIVSWKDLISIGAIQDPLAIKVAFIFIMVGFGTKTGLVPMHTWLPDAHSKAPVPLSALLSGVLLNVSFFAILRNKIVVDNMIGSDFSSGLLVLFGIVSIIIAAFIILVQVNYKRLLAYSSIEHMGIIALGFGFGGMGVLAGLLHMVFHSLAKSLLFLCSGNIFLKYSSTKISNVRGVLSALPFTGILFLFGVFAITGVPPFGLFFTEFYILSAGISSYPGIVALAMAGIIIVFVGFLRHATSMVFGEVPAGIKKGEFGFLTTAPLAVVAVILVGFGLFFPPFIVRLIESASKLFL
ncbi:MAG: proton-conducting transporter membrane subunit [Candidatus Paceibacterota bacterium]|jgi:hydrogenase-4 component F